MTTRTSLATLACAGLLSISLTTSSVAALEVYQQDQYASMNPSATLYRPDAVHKKMMAISERWHLKCEARPDSYLNTMKRCELDPTNGQRAQGDRYYRLLDGVKVELWNRYDPYRNLQPDVSVRIKGVIFNKQMAIEVGGKRFEKQASNKEHGYEWYSTEAGEIVRYLLNYSHLQYEYDLFARHINRSYQSLAGFREVWEHAVRFTGFNPLR